jgi:PAS domain S-box-containing protein
MIDEITTMEARAADRPEIELLLDGVKNYAIFLLDSQGGVLSWNDGAALLFGYQPAEVIGQEFSRFSIPEDIRAGKPAQELRQAQASGQITCENWQSRRDGSRFWGCAVTTALRDERGELKGFVKVLRDTTDRKHLEMELRRQAEELAESNRRKDEFLAMLSHELRNPLAPVLNSVQVLRQAPHDAILVEFAGRVVERQVLHLARLIDDLLDVTRLTHGKVRLRPERTELLPLVQRAAETVHPLMRERSHELNVSLPSRPIWIEADPVRLDQILVNLLKNAAEFTDPGGRIELAVVQDGADAVIRVRDDGVGIDPELLPRVFDMFAQADTSLDRSHGGLGIGLTLVKRLVTMHGGTIEGHSEGKGCGSEFVVRLPVSADATQEARTPAPAESARTGLRILVVDDNVDTASSLSILLQLHGHAVETAHDGASALDVSQSRTFDAILLDIGLPMIDGHEVARRIRKRGGDDQPVLVGISGYGFDDDHRRAKDAGFDLYLVKPVDPQRLEKELVALTTSRRGNPPSSGGIDSSRECGAASGPSAGSGPNAAPHSH